ncbi:hypothetical protein TYRP_011269 [Tyrophagus putrescentiae]|nr:hypothetical protein TYRP_011269 [Tyrophagus putrescentiae]
MKENITASHHPSKKQVSTSVGGAPTSGAGPGDTNPKSSSFETTNFQQRNIHNMSAISDFTDNVPPTKARDSDTTDGSSISLFIAIVVVLVVLCCGAIIGYLCVRYFGSKAGIDDGKSKKKKKKGSKSKRGGSSSRVKRGGSSKKKVGGGGSIKRGGSNADGGEGGGKGK